MNENKYVWLFVYIYILKAVHLTILVLCAAFKIL